MILAIAQTAVALGGISLGVYCAIFLPGVGK